MCPKRTAKNIHVFLAVLFFVFAPVKTLAVEGNEKGPPLNEGHSAMLKNNNPFRFHTRYKAPIIDRQTGFRGLVRKNGEPMPKATDFISVVDTSQNNVLTDSEMAILFKPILPVTSLKERMYAVLIYSIDPIPSKGHPLHQTQLRLIINDTGKFPDGAYGSEDIYADFSFMLAEDFLELPYGSPHPPTLKDWGAVLLYMGKPLVTEVTAIYTYDADPTLGYAPERAGLYSVNFVTDFSGVYRKWGSAKLRVKAGDGSADKYKITASSAITVQQGAPKPTAKDFGIRATNMSTGISVDPLENPGFFDVTLEMDALDMTTPGQYQVKIQVKTKGAAVATTLFSTVTVEGKPDNERFKVHAKQEVHVDGGGRLPSKKDFDIYVEDTTDRQKYYPPEDSIFLQDIEKVDVNTPGKYPITLAIGPKSGYPWKSVLTGTSTVDVGEKQKPKEIYVTLPTAMTFTAKETENPAVATIRSAKYQIKNHANNDLKITIDSAEDLQVSNSPAGLIFLSEAETNPVRSEKILLNLRFYGKNNNMTLVPGGTSRRFSSILRPNERMDTDFWGYYYGQVPPAGSLEKNISGELVLHLSAE